MVKSGPQTTSNGGGGEPPMTKSKKKRLRRKRVSHRTSKSTFGQESQTVQLSGSQYREVEDWAGEVDFEIKTNGFMKNIARDEALDAGTDRIRWSFSEDDDDDNDDGFFNFLMSCMFGDSDDSDDDCESRHYKKYSSNSKKEPSYYKSEDVDGFVGHLSNDVEFLMDFIEGKNKKPKNRSKNKKKGKTGAPPKVSGDAQKTAAPNSSAAKNMDQQSKKGGEKQMNNNKEPQYKTEQHAGKTEKETEQAGAVHTEETATQILIQNEKMKQAQKAQTEQNVLKNEKDNKAEKQVPNKKQEMNNNREGGGKKVQFENESNRKNHQNKENEAGEIFGKDAKKDFATKIPKVVKNGLRKSAN